MVIYCFNYLIWYSIHCYHHCELLEPFSKVLNKYITHIQPFDGTILEEYLFKTVNNFIQIDENYNQDKMGDGNGDDDGENYPECSNKYDKGISDAIEERSKPTALIKIAVSWFLIQMSL